MRGECGEGEGSGFTLTPQGNSLVQTVALPLRGHTARLASRELEHAVIVRVIHEVRDRVVARRRGARIATRGAAISSRLFRRRVRNVIVRLLTATLERMVQPEPVTHFMRARVTQVVRRGRATGKRRMKENDAVLRRSRRITRGERGITKNATAGITGPNVEVVSRTLASGGLHRRFRRTITAVVPRRIGRPIRGDELELETLAAISGIEDGNLVRNHCVRNIALRRARARIDDVPIHVDRDVTSGIEVVLVRSKGFKFGFELRRFFRREFMRAARAHNRCCRSGIASNVDAFAHVRRIDATASTQG